jgi:hypothetical protein
MKKGSVIMPEWLVKLIFQLLEIMSVILIIVGIGYVVVQSQKTPQDQDFKRVLDASAKLIDDYDAGKIYGKQEIIVPIVSEKQFQLAFYPDGKLESKCKNKPCLCMYTLTDSGEAKTTCKIIDMQQTCTGTCGGPLCAGPSYSPASKSKGNTIKIGIECTTQGSQFVVT